MAIDIHAHYVPPQLLAGVAAHGASFGVSLTGMALGFSYGFKVRPFFPKLVEDVKDRRASLDRQGLSRQLVATWPDIYGYGLPAADCIAWHRLLNDSLAEWCDANADRFSYVGSVPLPNAADAAAELDRIVGLGAVAVMIPANVEGVNIGEVALDPFWAKAEALKLPVILHPVMTAPVPRASKFALTQIVQYTYDTTLGIGSLIGSGVLDRFPGLSLVLSHGGGNFPYLVGRFDVMYRRGDRAAQAIVAAEAPSGYAPRMAYDTILHNPKALCFLIDLVGVDKVALGTDESFPPADQDPVGMIKQANLSPADYEAVAEGNARRLFPKLR